MPGVATRCDSLRWKVASTEVVHLSSVGEIPGVAILAVAARNGVGTGMLQSEQDGRCLRWKAPGSGAFGTPVRMINDGNALLEDGDDPSKWIRVAVTVSFLVPGAVSSRVFLSDKYQNIIGFTDVTAAEASAGDVKIYSVSMVNDGPHELRRVVVWLDAAMTDVEISDDGQTWVTPISQATGLSFANLMPNVPRSLWFRRTIAAAAAADPKVLNHIHARYYVP